MPPFQPSPLNQRLNQQPGFGQLFGPQGLFSRQPTQQAPAAPPPNQPTGGAPAGDPGLTRGQIDFSDFLNIPGGPTRDDFLARNLPALDPRRHSTEFRLSQMLADAFGGFGPAASQSTPLALANLNEILFNQGRTSPLLLNQQLSDIGRTTESQQTDLQGQLAQLGLQSSGVGQAIGAGIGQAGADRRAGAIAEETRLSEERQRQDLLLFQQLIQDPALQAAAIQLGVPLDTRPSTQDALLGAFGSLLGAFGSG